MYSLNLNSFSIEIKKQKQNRKHFMNSKKRQYRLFKENYDCDYGHDKYYGQGQYCRNNSKKRSKQEKIERKRKRNTVKKMKRRNIR